VIIFLFFSLVGHGGMGKSTLAQCVCQEIQEKNIAEDFKVIWVHVSIFDATSVTSKMLDSLTGAKPSADNLEALQKNLKQELNFVIFPSIG
jgi:ABC-type oligopeptide transport system ATPase subunit